MNIILHLHFFISFFNIYIRPFQNVEFNKELKTWPYRKCWRILISLFRTLFSLKYEWLTDKPKTIFGTKYSSPSFQLRKSTRALNTRQNWVIQIFQFWISLSSNLPIQSKYYNIIIIEIRLAEYEIRPTIIKLRIRVSKIKYIIFLKQLLSNSRTVTLLSLISVYQALNNVQLFTRYDDRPHEFFKDLKTV